MNPMTIHHYVFMKDIIVKRQFYGYVDSIYERMNTVSDNIIIIILIEYLFNMILCLSNSART